MHSEEAYSISNTPVKRLVMAYQIALLFILTISDCIFQDDRNTNDKGDEINKAQCRFCKCKRLKIELPE